MNLQEAIDLLDRPTREVSAETLAEARLLVANDAAAQAELDQRRALDERIREAFTAVPVPTHLKAAILAEFSNTQVADAETGSQESVDDNVIPYRPLWQRPWVFAAAAAVAMLVLLQGPLIDRFGETALVQAEIPVAELEVSNFVQALSANLATVGAYDQRSSDLRVLANYLREHGSPISGCVPRRFATGTPEGCRILKVAEIPVSMICLSDGQVVHLFIAPADMTGTEKLDKPLDLKVGDRSYVAWHEADRLMILGTRSSHELLHKHLVASAR